jgi:predicted nucleotidyltransferase
MARKAKHGDPPPILPVGTAVVSKVEIRGRGGRPLCPRGSVGVITRAPGDPEHRYRVRFPGGEEASLRRSDLAVLKHFQRRGVEPDLDPMAERDLYRFVIYRCVIGSRAYGLDHEESDTDRRGIYLPPAEMQWSLYGVPEQLENEETQECYWEIEKFLKLALKANPNVLEVLYSPMVEKETPLARELLDQKGIFLSRLVYQTYNGYVLSQFKKLGQDIRNRGSIKWKHAMHLIRLLLSGITALRQGFVPVEVSQYRERLLAIRDGRTPWEEVDSWRLSLHREFDRAYETTGLPEQPDYDAANAFLVKARRSMVT